MLPWAVIFDFDGVLADSEPLHLAGLRAALESRGLAIPTEDYYDHFLGYNDEDAMSAMIVRYGWPLTAGQQADLIALKLVHTKRLLSGPDVLFPGAAACVRRLSDAIPLAIASGATRDEIDVVLEAHGLAGAFRSIVASGDTARSKPAPDPYARALQLLQAGGAVPSQPDAGTHTVAIEDSRWGIASAKAAGLLCIGVTTSYSASELADADLVVPAVDAITIECLARVVEGARDRR